MTSHQYDLVYESTLIGGCRERSNFISATNLLLSAFSNRYSPDRLHECGGDLSIKKAKHNATKLWATYRKLEGLQNVSYFKSVPELGWTGAFLLCTYEEVSAMLDNMRDKGGSKETFHTS